MGSFGLKSFAFGMNEEITNLGRMAMGTDFGALPTMGSAPQPAALQAPPQQSGGGDVRSRFLSRLASHGVPEHVLAGIDMNAQDESGYNPSAIGDGGEAFGILQWNGPRRIALLNYAKERGLDPAEPETQADFTHYEGNTSERAAWEAVHATSSPGEAGAAFVELFERPAAEHLARRRAAYLGGGAGAPMSMSSRGASTPFVPGSELAVDTSELEKLAGNALDPQTQKKQFQGSLLMGIGQGLSQLSRGETPDISNVMNSYYSRQSEARQRLMEIQMEKRRQQERGQDRSWQLQDQITAQDQQIAAEMRGETREIAAEERNITRIEKQNEAVSNSLGLLYPDSPSLKAAQEVAKLNPEVGLAWLEQKTAEEKAAAKEAATMEQNEAIASVYEQQGFEDIATMARNGDLIGARDIYKERTGTTDAQLDARVLQNGGPDAIALATRLRLESGAPDPQQAGAVALEQSYLNKSGEAVLANREKLGQLEAMTALIQDPTLNSGAFEAAMLPFKQYLADLGIGDLENVSKQTVVDAMGNNLISFMRRPGEGVVSDADASRFTKAAPGLSKSPIANQVLTHVYAETLRRESAAHDARVEYFANNGDVGNAQARDAYIAKKIKDQFGEGPILPQVSTAAEAALIEDGKPYIGPDNKFYVNTPNGPAIGG